MFIHEYSQFIIAKWWETSKCTAADEWMKKMWYIHTVEYFLAIKSNEALIAQMNLENIMVTQSVTKGHI